MPQRETAIPMKCSDWNEYIIRANGPRITTWIQVHGGSKGRSEAEHALPN